MTVAAAKLSFQFDADVIIRKAAVFIMKRRRSQGTLDSFVKRVPGLLGVSKEVVEQSCDARTSVNIADESSSSDNFSTATTASYADNTSSVIRQNDVGSHIDSISEISDFVKCELLERPWKPPRDYNLPFSTHRKKGKDERRYLHQSHLDKFPWLVYSDAKKGLFCKYCSLFIVGGVGGSHNHVALQRLVTKPLTTFAKLLGKDGDLMKHENQQYHRDAVEAGKNFLITFRTPEQDIVNQLNSQRLKQVLENRDRLKPIVESVIFLGRQNIAFRGHRDDGALLKEVQEPLANEGNFRELLRYRVQSGDATLKLHLEKGHSNATYISKTTQNQLIECCGEEIRSVIRQRIEEAKYYCLIFDETTDISHSSQLTLCVSYVYKNSRHEDFLGFLNVHDSFFKGMSSSHEPKVSGKALGQLVLDKVKELHLDVLNCVGVATDGCALMVSEQLGAVSEIKKEALNASRCPCFNHALNLSMSKTSSVSSVRNAIETIKEVVSFFNASAKRSHVLLNVVKAQLRSMCETRWVERTESLVQFLDNLQKITEALEYISEWSETKSASRAGALIFSIRNAEFVITLVCQLSIFMLCLPLSRLFQKKNLDLSSATTLVTDLKSILKTRRENCEDEFCSLFQKASQVLSDLDVVVALPRINRRQVHRDNVPASSPEQYYRRSIYLPMLDSFIFDLETRFSTQTLASCQLTSLLPRNCTGVDHTTLSKTIYNAYGGLLGHVYSAEAALCSEIQLWKEKWARLAAVQENEVLPTTVEEALQQCDEDVYAIIHSLLKVLLTLPVSVASAERSFSSLRSLKTWLRNKIGEERLSGLALLHQHRDISIDVDAVINRFAKGANRKIDFIL